MLCGPREETVGHQVAPSRQNYFSQCQTLPLHSLKASFGQLGPKPHTTNPAAPTGCSDATEPLCLPLPSNPNEGYSKVPVNWPPYTEQTTYYLDINNKLGKKSVKQDLRAPFVTFWNSVYRSLPQVANITQTL